MAGTGTRPLPFGKWARTVEAFGAYGFCRAHAVAFAVPALQSAWLKAHCPAFLLVGLLEHDPGLWPKRFLVADARRGGVQVRLSTSTTPR